MTRESESAAAWVPYLRPTDRGPVSTLVDVQFRRYEGSASLDTVVRVRTSLAEPGEHGLGSQQEVESLDELLKRGVRDVGETIRVAWVASQRMNGSAQWWLYASRAHVERLRTEVVRAFSPRAVDVKSEPDPEWAAYRKLLPTRKEERELQDYRVVEQLKAHGDPLDPVRDVRHYAYFSSAESAGSFARAVAGRGFECEVRPAADGTAGRVCVVASRDDAVQWPAITEITSQVESLAEHCGGEYDGWEAALVRKQGFLSRLFGRGSA